MKLKLCFVWDLAQFGDPAAAEALWTHATSTSVDLRDPIYVDVAREIHGVRPWQPEYAALRGRLRQIEGVRLGTLRPPS